MDALIPIFDACWGLLWFPLANLSLDSFLLACPFLLMVIMAIVGLVCGIFRGF